ncbi:hypothetical protein RUND412_006003 [Rhizina undulata]
MSIDHRTRQLHGGFNGGGYSQPTIGGPPIFTNPWSSASPSQASLLAGSYPTEATGMNALSKADYRSSSLSTFPSIPTSAIQNSRHMSTPGIMSTGPMPTSTDMLAPFHSASQYATDISMTGSSAPSPTASASYTVPTFAPVPLEFQTQARSYQLANDRRMSQPAISNPMFYGSPVEVQRPRINSYVEMSSNRQLSQTPRSDAPFGTDGMESARSMMSLGQPPRQQRAHSDTSQAGFYPTHSASSSISSTTSYPYYGGGSVDSSATDYSDTTTYPVETSNRALIRRPNPSSGFPVTSNLSMNNMISSFSSKISPSTQKKHKCRICDKRFTRPSSLQTHTYSHTGEKPFQCDIEGCERRFSVVSNLRRHKKVHNKNN